MNDLHHIAEAILLLYHFWTFLVALLVLYILFRDGADKTGKSDADLPVTHGDAREVSDSARVNAPATLAFAVLVLVSLGSGHYLVTRNELFFSFLALICGFVAATSVYFTWIAGSVQRPAIRYILFVWVALGLSITAIIGFFSWGNFRAAAAGREIRLDEVASIATPILQFGGILIAAVMVAMTNLFTAEQERKSARRAQKSDEESIYQTLELASVSLFRFEAANPDLVAALWYAEPRSREARTRAEKIAEHNLEQYICQHLNLFEMAFRLRRSNVVPPDVYASWVAWMYELCALPVFAQIWTQDLRHHYVTDFMQMMDSGVELASRDTRGDGFGEQAERFYAIVASKVGNGRDCPHILNWLQHRAGEPAPVIP